MVSPLRQDCSAHIKVVQESRVEAIKSLYEDTESLSDRYVITDGCMRMVDLAQEGESATESSFRYRVQAGALLLHRGG